MVTTILQGAATSTSTANTDEYWPLVGGVNKRSSEPNAEIKIRAAGTLHNLWCKISANSVAATSTFTLRKNTTTDLTNVISVGSNATGDVEDATPHNDTIAAADRLTMKTHPGAATGTFTIEIISILFDATTDTVSIFNNSGTVTASAASTTTFYPLTGNITATTATAANCKVRFRKAGTFKNLGIFVSANRAQASTVRMVKNAAVNGNLAASITGGGSSGWYEDTGNSDTVTAADDWYISVTTGTGADNLTWQNLKTEFTSTNGDGVLANCHPVTVVAVTDNTNRFFYLGGVLAADTAETGVGGTQTKARVAFTASEITCLVTQNDCSTGGTLMFRKGAADTALVASITGNNTGVFSDSSHTVAVVATDLICSQVVVPAVSGTHTVTVANITISTNIVPTTRLETTRILKYDITGRAQSNRILKYNITGRILSNRILKYNIQQRIESNRILKYNIQQRIQSSRILKYNIVGRILSSRILKYNITGRVQSSRIIKYNLLNLVQTSRILKYNIMGRVQSSRILKYNIIQRIQTSLILKYDIAESLARVETSRIIKYDILQRVTSSRILKYDIIGRVLSSRILKYNIQQRIATSRILKYNIQERVLSSRVIKYNIQQRIQSSRILKYNILNLVQSSRIIKYNIVGRVQSSLVIKYDIISALIHVETSRIIKYNITGRVLSSRVIKYDILQRVMSSRIIKYNLLNLVQTSRIIKYNILQRVTSSRIIKYDLLNKVTTSLTIKYDIMGRVRTSVKIKYNIVAAVTTRVGRLRQWLFSKYEEDDPSKT